MEFISNQYYHIYNRTNNKELLIRTNEIMAILLRNIVIIWMNILIQ